MNRNLVFLAAAALAAAVSCADSNPPSPVVTLDVENPGNEEVAVGQEVAVTELPPMQDGWICRPGESKCMGSVLLVCNQAGSDFLSIPCGSGSTCTPDGCIGTPDVIVGNDVIGNPETVTPEDVTPQQDVAQFQDLVETAVDTAPGEIIVIPIDTFEAAADPGQPQETVNPNKCGTVAACATGEECCATGGSHCVATGQCNPQPTTCQGAQDCIGGQQCCPGGPPGSPGTCKNSCGGIGNVPTCKSDTDCIGGQTCVNLTLSSLCLSECAADTDCNGQTCQKLGYGSYVLASVCGCGVDGDCAEGLLCCTVPYVKLQTCMTSCM